MEEIGLERVQDPATPGRLTLKVTGRSTISEAFLLREALIEALEGNDQLLVDLTGLEAVDLTGLQLLCAAHQSAEKAGKGFEIDDEGNEMFRTVVADAGFQRHIGCACDTTSRCIWVGGDN